MSHPGDLSSEALNVILLTLQHILRHKEREGAVLHTHLLDTEVEVLLDLFPDEVRGGLEGACLRWQWDTEEWIKK
jgi:hypothetical protein